MYSQVHMVEILISAINIVYNEQEAQKNFRQNDKETADVSLPYQKNAHRKYIKSW